MCSFDIGKDSEQVHCPVVHVLGRNRGLVGRGEADVFFDDVARDDLQLLVSWKITGGRFWIRPNLCLDQTKLEGLCGGLGGIVIWITAGISIRLASRYVILYDSYIEDPQYKVAPLEGLSGSYIPGPPIAESCSVTPSGFRIRLP